MSIRVMIPLALLVLGLTACDSGEQAGSSEPAQPAATGEAETTSSAGASEAAGEAETSMDDASKPAPPDPEQLMSAGDGQSDRIWSLIQENHSELSDQHQRSLQSCALLAVRDKDAAVEDAVEQCLEKMKELAEEQQQEESDSGNGEEESASGQGDG